MMAWSGSQALPLLATIVAVGASSSSAAGASPPRRLQGAGSWDSGLVEEDSSPPAEGAGSWAPDGGDAPAPSPVTTSEPAPAGPPPHEGCHVSDDLTCGAFALTVLVLFVAFGGMVVFKKISNRDRDFDEGRTLYNEDDALSESRLLGQSADVQLDDYGMEAVRAPVPCLGQFHPAHLRHTPARAVSNVLFKRGGTQN